MNLKYLLLNTTDINYAWLLSRALWRITQPSSNEDTTMYYSTPIEGPDMVALPIGGDSHRVHPDADLSDLLSYFQNLTTEERADVQVQFEAARGSRVTIESLLPESWQSAFKTREELEQMGWFASKQTAKN